MTNSNFQDNPSLCIPKVERSIKEKDIRDIFTKLNLGTVDRIDIVLWKKNTNNSNKFVRIFVHLKSWNESAINIKNNLLNGSTYNIVYSFPWFWKIVVSRLPKPNY